MQSVDTSTYSLSDVFAFGYRNVLKPLFFRFDPELIHEMHMNAGETAGKYQFTRTLTSMFFNYQDVKLRQTLAGTAFSNPIGLAAGFDYEAKLTQILPNIGFGFGSVGTITHHAYAGNPKPRLGRLPKSRSILVNKGFKNLGAKTTANKLKKYSFAVPIGVSIGQTNSPEVNTQQKAIADILYAFQEFETQNVQNAYYELNISCPNLSSPVSFYSPKNLNHLLKEVDRLKLNKPLFIKMPIKLTNKETLALCETISKHSPKGIILGNLQTNRHHPAIDQTEAAKFSIGNFSGKPTFERSNELIAFSFKHFKKRLIIIGCGGVFNADDAFAKIAAGASLVQLITGMIFEGPQLIGQINLGLTNILTTKGLKNIHEAIGIDHQ